MRTTLRGRGRLLAGLLAIAVVVGAGTAYALNHRSAAVAVAVSRPVPAPGVTVSGTHRGLVSWQGSLVLTASAGRLRSVTGTDIDGAAVSGTVTGSSWTSTSALTPSSTYRLTAVVVDAAGKARHLEVTARTSAAQRFLRAQLNPGDGAVVGVGMPVSLILDRPVDASDRSALVDRLRVTSTPAVQGGWRWMSSTELHYRGPSYWARGSSITVHADLTRLRLSGGVWGKGILSTTYAIGDSMVSTVDVGRHTMTVRRNGQLVRTVKVSTGRAKYPTKGGVHLVLEKTALKIMDSATVGIPRNSPAGYYEKVPFSVRISYSGEFVHSADWSVRDQGVRNVSHGCINISPTDAKWFFSMARRGDVVDVKNTRVAPLLSDPGTSDWNIPFSAWAN